MEDLIFIKIGSSKLILIRTIPLMKTITSRNLVIDMCNTPLIIYFYFPYKRESKIHDKMMSLIKLFLTVTMYS